MTLDYNYKKYKTLSDKRRALLDDIRLLIKREFPQYFPGGHDRQPTMEILEAIIAQTKATERGRDAFRDELMRLGYQHTDLVELVEKQNAD